MATWRQRSAGSWEFIVKRKGVLPKPLYLSFDTEKEGVAYCAKLEALLDKGIIPPEFAVRSVATLDQLVEGWGKEAHMSETDRALLPALTARVEGVKLSAVDYAWCEGWIAAMKRTDGLSPSTIRHYVGALARCFDWGGKRHPELAVNLLRMLPKGYSSYTPADVEAAGFDRDDTERDRRLEEGEEAAIRAVLSGKSETRQSPPGSARRVELLFMFDLALETAMRLREMFTLTVDQLDLEKRTIFLDRTKNGDKRAVPMSSVLRALAPAYLRAVKPSGLLFPFWDGDASVKSLKATSSRLSSQWGRIFEAAGCPDLGFHDLRHEATSRIFERTTLDPVSISRITGHRDPRMLRRYANLRGSDLSDKLW